MAAGSIIIDLLMRTGAFETDTKRAEKRLKEMQKTAEAAGKAIGIGIAAGLTAAVVAFDQLNKAAGDFQDFAEMVGDSAENIASLSVAAAQAGVSMESVTSASIKLTKGLVGVDDESKAAGAALAALGLNVEDFKKLDPVAQYEAVGKALNGFADGAGKTAVAVALFGKSGAEQLKVFKALEEQGGRTVILTQKQIEAADAYADASARNTATLKLYAQAAATELLPAFTDLTTAAKDFAIALVGVDAASGTLTKDNALRDFGYTLAEGLAFAADQLVEVGTLFNLAGKSIGAYFAVAVNLLKGDLQAAKDAGAAAASDIKKSFDESTLGAGKSIEQRIKDARAARLAAEANPASYSNEGRAPTKLRIAFDGAEKAERAAKQSDAEKYTEALRNQLQTTKELTVFEKLLDDLSRGRIKGVTDGQLLVLKNLAVEVDATKALTEQRKKDSEILAASNKLVGENFEQAQRLAESVEKPVERLNRELLELERIAAANPFLSQETQARLAADAWKKYGDAVSAANEKTNTFATQAAASIQDALGDATLRTITGGLKGIEKQWLATLQKLAAQAIAAKLGEKLFGGQYGKTGEIGGLFGDLAKYFNSGSVFGGTGSTDANLIGDYALPARANGGPVSAGQPYMVGEGGPERFVPSTAGRIIPASAAGKSSPIQVINPPGVPLQATASEEQQPDGSTLKRIILSTVQQDARRGGPAIKATAGALGQSRQLPRRGR